MNNVGTKKIKRNSLRFFKILITAAHLAAPITLGAVTTSCAPIKKDVPEISTPSIPTFNYDFSDAPLDENYKKELKTEVNIRSEIIRKQANAVKEEMGDAYYDYNINKGFEYNIDYDSTSLLAQGGDIDNTITFPKTVTRFIYPQKPYCSYIKDENGNLIEYNEDIVYIYFHNFNKKETEYATKAIADLDDILKSVRFEVTSNLDYKTDNLYIQFYTSPKSSFNENVAGTCESQCDVANKIKDEKFNELYNNKYEGKYPLATINIREDQINSYYDEYNSWDILRLFPIQEYNTSYFATVIRHEMGHAFGLTDIYKKDNYTPHPNTGATIMDKAKNYTERDKWNLDYIYNGKYYETLKRVDREVREEYANKENNFSNNETEDMRL